MGLTAWERWELASFDTPKPLPIDVPEEAEAPAEPPEPAVVLPTAEELAAIRAEAQREGREQGLTAGHEEGYAAGYQEGQAAARAEAERLGRAAGHLDEALGQLDQAVADELLALALEVARQVVRREVALRPESILDVVREALSQLPHQHAAIYLCPDDASLVRSYLGDTLTHAGHRIHEDSKLAAGDCILEAGGSQIDATVATRWRRVLDGLGLESAWNTEEAP